MAYRRGKKWCVKYREVDTERQMTAYFDSKEEAELWQAKFKYDRKHNKKAVQPATVQDRTLSGVVKAYYQSRKGEIKASTIKSDFYRLNKAILPIIGARPIRQITKSDIEAVIEDSRERGNKNVSINRALDILRSVFAYAVSMEIVESAPTVRRLKDDRDWSSPHFDRTPRPT